MVKQWLDTGKLYDDPEEAAKEIIQMLDEESITVPPVHYCTMIDGQDPNK